MLICNHRASKGNLIKRISIMNSVLLIFIFILFLQSASTSENNNNLKTFQYMMISDNVSGAHAGQNKSLLYWCPVHDLVILVSREGDVIIYDPESYEERIGYYAPELYHKNIGVVNREFYSIDPKQGIIRSTGIEQIISPSIDKNGKRDIKWKYVGSFRDEKDFCFHHLAVKGNTMYFGTYVGIFYSYNTKSKKVEYRFSLPDKDVFASLIMFDDVLYIFRHKFYSYDGNSLKVLKTPGLLINLTEINPNMFIFRSTICTVGGIVKEGEKDKMANYPVYCWDPKKENSKWQILNYSYEAREMPAIVTTSHGSFVFGGSRTIKGAHGASSTFTKTIEMLDHNTLKWSYVPNAPSMILHYYSAVTFNCN